MSTQKQLAAYRDGVKRVARIALVCYPGEQREQAVSQRRSLPSPTVRGQRGVFPMPLSSPVASVCMLPRAQARGGGLCLIEPRRGD